MSYIRIDSDHTSYVLDLTSAGIPKIVYWGSLLDKNTDPKQLGMAISKPVYQAGLDTPYHLNLFPENGTGVRGKPAHLGHRNGKDWATQFKIKQTIENNNHIQIILVDDIANLELILEIIMDQASGVLARRSCLKNTFKTPYQLHYCASGAIDVVCHAL
jgi:alpha-galactosidase